ncbi:MAG: hypothetical protein M4579_001835 [Chaenotheca gracillima]|nr:MAG: hypothetical protein M4579_001835 [Chaenotheca gracillima]
MRIGCVQFKPVLGEVALNTAAADAIIEKANLQNLDLLMFPELALTGYNHPSLESIEPYLEPTTSGPSTDYARRLALHHNCHVSIGYPETTLTSPPKRYNSVVLLSPTGDVLVNYRKSFLYYTDETWAEEGDGGFYAGKVDRLGKISMGICMDINPQKFTAPWDSYEFSNHALAASSDLIILTMAWLSSPASDPSSGLSPPSPPEPSDPSLPNIDTLSYWLARLKPFIEAPAPVPASSPSQLLSTTESELGPGTPDDLIIAICNRAGAETTAQYAGTSTVLSLSRDGKGKVRILGVLGEGVEEVLVVDTTDKERKGGNGGRWVVSRQNEEP